MSDEPDIEFAPELPAVPPVLRLRPLADVQPRLQRWLKKGLIPMRALTLVAGVGGLGKSMWLAAVAAAVSTGQLLGEPGDVIIVSFEDAAEEVLRPRLEAAGADLARVHIVVVEEHDDLGIVQLPRHVFELWQLVQSVHARLVVIDPIVAAIETDYDAHKDQHVRAVLAQLQEIAGREVCAVALVGHLNKAPSLEAYIRVANSVAFWNACRSVVLVTEDGDDTDLRLVAQRKSNYLRLHPVERHRIDELVLPDTVDAETGKPIETSRMVFVEYADDVDSADVLGARPRGENKEMRAVRFLLDALADGDWHDSARLKALAEAQGLPERTLQRAAKDLEVDHESRGFPRSTWWQLASRAKNPASNTATVGATVEPAPLSQKQAPVAPVAPTVSVAPPLARLDQDDAADERQKGARP